MNKVETVGPFPDLESWDEGFEEDAGFETYSIYHQDFDSEKGINYWAAVIVRTSDQKKFFAKFWKGMQGNTNLQEVTWTDLNSFTDDEEFEPCEDCDLCEDCAEAFLDLVKKLEEAKELLEKTLVVLDLAEFISDDMGLFEEIEKFLDGDDQTVSD